VYIDAIYSSKESKVKVVERVNGKRVYKDYPPVYEYYLKDPSGRFKSIYGESLSKVTARSHGEYQKSLRINSHKKKYESDIKPVNKVLEKYYQHQNPPELHIAFFDIETAFDKETGYSEPEEAGNPITAISVHLQWLNETVCLSVPPETLSMDQAKEIADKVGRTILFHEEAHMLDAFLTLIDDADILSGWNSEGYDIPYVVNRIMKLLGRNEARKLCLWGEMPTMRWFARGAKEQQTYDLSGRVHLDYLQLYKKFNYEERHSYALDAIAEIELGENKVAYDGTLDQLYNNDYEKFLRYSLHDTDLLNMLDRKLQFADLASGIAHGNCVLIPSALGAVAVTEQAIIIEAHEKDAKVPDRVRDESGEEDLPAAGGWVQHPKKGLHQWIGSSDLNSLYPSVIRALNMSPETIVGQLRTEYTDAEIRAWVAKGKTENSFAMWWNDRFNTLEMEAFLTSDNADRFNLDMEDGNSYEVTGADLRHLVFDSGHPWCITANGTIFRTDVEGIIPGLLSRWYSERKKLQAIAKDYKALEVGIDLDLRKDTITEISENLKRKRSSGTDINVVNPTDPMLVFSIANLRKKAESKGSEDLYQYMLSHKLTFDAAGHIRHSDPAELKKIVAFWDKRQLVKKINLNSLYGGLLNPHCRFYDKRLGQSTTLTGRSIAKHMAAKTNEFLDNSYDHTGRAVIYGDTDSVYFSAYPMLHEDIKAGRITWDKDSVIELYDVIAKQVSDSFPAFMKETFNVPLERGDVIRSGREIVAETGLFITKKRYAVLAFDVEGNRQDIDGKPGKLKAVGLDLRRSDTQVIVQKFLKDILLETLQLKGEDAVINSIREFKKKFAALRPWEKGSPTAVKNLSKYQALIEGNMKKVLSGKASEKSTIPGHVMASFNWNLLRESHNDIHTTKIVDGQKVIVCKLKANNDMKMTSVAYPVDEPHLPDWFIKLPFDEEAMMESEVDKKVENLLSVLGWNLIRTTADAELMETLFDFG
jgi:DNA polymerase elongation subunit (family B)